MQAVGNQITRKQRSMLTFYLGVAIVNPLYCMTCVTGSFLLFRFDTPLMWIQLQEFATAWSVSLKKEACLSFHPDVHIKEHRVRKASESCQAGRLKDIQRKLADSQTCCQLQIVRPRRSHANTVTQVSKTIKRIFKCHFSKGN